jgi:DNA-binding transcriptional MocR family regulator
MTLSIAVDRTAASPIYQQIAEQIKEQICAGHLPAATRLPTVRSLAGQLAVTRLTVQNAYAELQSGGWIEATVGRGTFVSRQLQPAPRLALAGAALTPGAVIGDILQIGHTQGVRSLASASPDPALFPAEEFWLALAAQQPSPAVLGYGPAQGDTHLRLALADLLAERGVEAGPGEILVTAGVTQGLALAAQALAQPGDVVLVEQPTYIGFLHQLRTFGLQPVGVPVDADGPRLEAVERLAVQLRPRFFYTIPSFQNPTGACMPAPARQALVTLAETHGFTLVEDDLYAPLAYAEPAPPALKAFDHRGVVVYVNSFSKTLMPGLRLGYMVAPAALLERLVSLRLAADLGSPPLLQRTLASFLHGGGLRRHLKRVLPLYGARRDAMLQALRQTMPASVTWTAPSGGLCCWLTLPRRRALADLPQLLVEQGWAAAPGEVFLAQPAADLHLRLSFGTLPPEAIRRGVETLARIVREQLAQPANERENPIGNGSDWTPLV